jgi:DNA-binding NtrC family response regulator
MLSASTATALSRPSLNRTPQLLGANFLNLLIMDEDRVVREALRDAGHSLGFSAHVAESADQAYRMLEADNIDAVLLEIGSSGGAGLEGLRSIKQRRPDAVVVVLTNSGTVQSAVQAMKEGATTMSPSLSAWRNCVLLGRVAEHLRLKTEPSAARNHQVAAGFRQPRSGARRTWKSSTASLPKPGKARIRC